jgi:uncharacterized protein (DUF362 family)
MAMGQMVRQDKMVTLAMAAVQTLLEAIVSVGSRVSIKKRASAGCRWAEAALKKHGILQFFRRLKLQVIRFLELVVWVVVAPPHMVQTIRL